MMSSYWSALFTSLITMALADYECLCNYNEETGVHSASQVMNLPDLGMLYEFDCKPTYQPVTGLHNWQAIQFEKQVGYVRLDGQTKIQTCPGQPEPSDIVTQPPTTISTAITPKPPSFTTTPFTVVSGASHERSTSITQTNPNTVTVSQSTSFSSSPSTVWSTTEQTPNISTSMPTQFKATSSVSPTTQTLTTYTSPTIRHTSIPSPAVSITRANTSETTKRPLQCPPQVPSSRNMKEFANHCYEFILGIHKKWPEAEHDCNHRGGHLVSIGSSSEQIFIYNSLGELNFHGDKGVWIGFTDQDKEDDWRWSSGDSVVFKYWDHGQPGYLGSFKDCAMMDMRNNGRWIDISCSGYMFNPEQHGYVCEYKKI